MSKYVGAGNAKIVTRNQGGGTKKQGLAPCATHYFMANATGQEYYTETGDGVSRRIMSCVNQLGGISRGRTQFRSNADGKRGCNSMANGYFAHGTFDISPGSDTSLGPDYRPGMIDITWQYEPDPPSPGTTTPASIPPWFSWEGYGTMFSITASEFSKNNSFNLALTPIPTLSETMQTFMVNNLSPKTTIMFTDSQHQTATFSNIFGMLVGTIPTDEPFIIIGLMAKNLTEDSIKTKLENKVAQHTGDEDDDEDDDDGGSDGSVSTLFGDYYNGKKVTVQHGSPNTKMTMQIIP